MSKSATIKSGIPMSKTATHTAAKSRFSTITKVIIGACAAILVLGGLFMLGMLKLDWLHRDLRFHGNIKGARPIGAKLIGPAFAFG